VAQERKHGPGQAAAPRRGKSQGAARTRREAARESGVDDAPSGAAPALRPEDALAFMQKMWNPFGLPMPGFGPPAAGMPMPGFGAPAAGGPMPGAVHGLAPGDTYAPGGAHAPGATPAPGAAQAPGVTAPNPGGFGTFADAPAFASPGPTGAPAMPFGAPPFPNPATMLLALDPAEVARKIDELRVVEGWLQMTLGMMQMSIRTLELQKAALEAMRGVTGTPPPATGG
jgi:hypothetical protein